MWAADGGDFITNMRRRGRHKRRHVIVVPEVHLVPEDIWKGDSWCRACGLKAVWAPAYREEGGEECRQGWQSQQMLRWG